MKDARRRAPKRGTKPPAGGKPPYRTPTLEQVRKARRNGLTCISIFSGAGGSSIGYRLAGYRILAAVDLDETAAASYRANFPETVVLERDIRELTGRELLRAAKVRKGELDLLDGSPPCTPFSSAGRRQKTWGQERAHAGTRQRVDDLFLEFARLLGETQPRAFAAENVTGLAKGVSVGYFREIRAALAEQGYHVEVRNLDAQWMGVPQARQRVIFAGVRADVWKRAGRERIPWPKPLPYRYSVREALPWLDPTSEIWTTRGTPFGGPGEKISPGSATEVFLPEGAPARTIAGPSGHGHEVRVVHDNGRPNEPAQEVLERPALTIGISSEGHDQVRVVHNKRRPDVEPIEILDRPSPTIVASEADKYSGPFSDVELELSGRSGSGFERTPQPLDEPAQTVGAAEQMQRLELELRVMHDTQGGDHAGPPRDVADEPSPAITGGSRGWNAEHFQVEQRIAPPIDSVEMIVGNDAFEPRFGPLDEPTPTLTASGARTSGEIQARVEHETGGQFASHGDITDEPSPTIKAGSQTGGGTKSDFQVTARVEHDTRGGQLASQGDVTDEPAPTVLAGAEHGRASDFAVAARVEHDTRGQYATPGEITDRPSPTITLAGIDGGGGAGQHFKVVREDEHGVTLKRKFTILEVKRLFGFPDDYELAGKYHEQWAQLGNSVCPAMSRGVGKALEPILRSTRRPSKK